MPFEIFFKNVRLPMNCHLSEITEYKYTSLIKMIILEENFKWHLEAFASELFKYSQFKRSIQQMHESLIYFPAELEYTQAIQGAFN